VLDATLRKIKDRALNPIVRQVTGVSPLVLTFLSLASCVAAAVAAWRHAVVVSVVLWLVGRLLDGLDGPVARLRGVASELGGYLDLMADVIGYAVVPIGVAAAQQSVHIWMWCAVLLASFYVNTMSWTLLSALAERHEQHRVAEVGTTFRMPTALVEGAETIVLFSLMLALPRYVLQLFAIMSIGVGISIVQRVVWAIRNLS
jgi:phosphatidylglycerophosphate synthase